MRTDRAIQANRPHIVIKDKQNKTCQLIDMTVPSYSNISAKIEIETEFEIELLKIYEKETCTNIERNIHEYELPSILGHCL